PPNELCRTLQAVRTDRVRSRTHQSGATAGAVSRHPERLAALGRIALVGDALYHLRYDVTGTLDADVIALPDVLAFAVVDVVQVGPADGHAAYVHRSQHRYRRYHPRPTDAGHDAQDLADLLPGLELQRVGPAWVMR